MTVHACGNMDCFYYETIFDLEDLVVQNYFEHRTGFLSVRLLCPSCREECDRMDEDDFPIYVRKYANGTIQTQIRTKTKA